MKSSQWNPDGTYHRPIRDLPEFFARARRVGGADAVAVAEAAVRWVEGCKGGSPVLGKGIVRGPLYLTVPDRVGNRVKVLAIDTDGGMGVNYSHMSEHSPYRDVEERLRLNRQLNAIKGISIDDHYAVRCSWPKISLETLRNEATRSAFFRVFDDVAVRLAGAMAT